MGAEQKQIQSFNGDEQIQLKQGSGRYNLFAKISDLLTYFGNSDNEVLTVSFNDKITLGTGSMATTPTNNTNTTAGFYVYGYPSLTLLTALKSYQWNTGGTTWGYGNGHGDSFTVEYKVSELPSGDDHIRVYCVVQGDAPGLANYSQVVPVGNGNQTLYFALDGVGA
jgi:hypothetical protein